MKRPIVLSLRDLSPRAFNRDNQVEISLVEGGTLVHARVSVSREALAQALTELHDPSGTCDRVPAELET